MLKQVGLTVRKSGLERDWVLWVGQAPLIQIHNNCRQWAPWQSLSLQTFFSNVCYFTYWYIKIPVLHSKSKASLITNQKCCTGNRIINIHCTPDFFSVLHFTSLFLTSAGLRKVSCWLAVFLLLAFVICCSELVSRSFGSCPDQCEWRLERNFQ